MTETIFFLGWDVGPWKCTGDSQDALRLLKWSNGGLSVAGESFHGNLLDITDTPTSPEQLLSVVQYPELPDNSKIVLAIDAVFGWPRQFRCLLGGRAEYTPAVGRRVRNTQNRYLYRETERFLDAEFKLGSHPPMTAVGDAIGSAATKAQYFLTRMREAGEVYVPPLDEWSQDRAKCAQKTVIEVYPGATKKSTSFQSLCLPNGTRVSTLETGDLYDAMRAALVAACYACTVGMIPGNFPLVYTPSDVTENDEFDSLAFPQEGWIFTPRGE